MLPPPLLPESRQRLTYLSFDVSGLVWRRSGNDARVAEARPEQGGQDEYEEQHSDQGNGECYLLSQVHTTENTYSRCFSS